MVEGPGATVLWSRVCAPGRGVGGVAGLPTWWPQGSGVTRSATQMQEMGVLCDWCLAAGPKITCSIADGAVVNGAPPDEVPTD
jgi:hypothetical protein